MKIHDAAVRYLSYRDRTNKEMQEHLLGKGFKEDAVHEEIKALTDIGYLDDVRFAKLFIVSSMDKGRGMRRIRHELRQKGVAAFDIEDGLAAAEEEYGFSLPEKERAIAGASAARFMEGQTADRKILARLSRRLASAGFGAGLIYDIIDQYKDTCCRD